MQKIDSALLEKLTADPLQSVALIVRSDGDPTPHLSRLEGLGFQIGHQFRLLPGVSVTGSAAAALSLLDEEWVIGIEEDRPIRTM
jgi:hypothetical protein